MYYIFLPRNQVEVYLNSWSDSTEQGIRLQQESIGAVIYLHLSQFDASRSPDVFVAWRYPISLALFPAMKTKSRRTFSMLWLHDLIPLASQPDILTSFVRIVYCLMYNTYGHLRRILFGCQVSSTSAMSTHLCVMLFECCLMACLLRFTSPM